MHTTAKYDFVNAVTVPGKIEIMSTKDFPIHSNSLATRQQQVVVRSIENVTLTTSTKPNTIPNALERQRRDLLQYKVQFS